MQSSHDDNTAGFALQKIVNALEVLLTLRDPAHKVSNGAKIIAQLKQIQEAFHALDNDSRTIIFAHLKIGTIPIYVRRWKKGSKIIKPFELAGEIHDDLPTELRAIIATNPSLANIKTTAIPSFETESDFFMPDTVRVTETKAADNALQAALDSAARHKDQTDYIANSLFGSLDTEPLHPLSAVVEALDTLRKTKINKDKIQSGEPKPPGFDNMYRETLLKQINILNINKNVFTTIALGEPHQSVLTEITAHLTDIAQANIPNRLTHAGAISALVNNGLITKLRQLEAKLQPDTPRYQ